MNPEFVHLEGELMKRAVVALELIADTLATLTTVASTMTIEVGEGRQYRINRAPARSAAAPGPDLFGGAGRKPDEERPSEGRFYKAQRNGPIVHPTKGEPYYRTPAAAKALGLTARELNDEHRRGKIGAFRKSEAPHAARYWPELEVRRYALEHGIELEADMTTTAKGIGE